MIHYLMNFSVYTMAMIGIMFIALFAYKFVSSGAGKKSSMMSVIDTMKLSTRKTLYVVKAENEKFLIAADLDKTALIAKLDDAKLQNQKIREDKSTKLKSFDGLKSIDDFTSLVDVETPKTKKGPMMKELAKKLNTIDKTEVSFLKGFSQV